MKATDKFREYTWLVETIRRAGRISLSEINEKWLRTEMSGGVELARTTFIRNKEAIEDMFGIIIDCDRKNGYKYFIDNAKVLKENSVQNWMMSTISVSNTISESLTLQNRILLQPVTFANYHLPTVLDAMKKSVRIGIMYQRYGAGQPRQMNIEPYCVKLFKQRWYVLGHFCKPASGNEPETDYFGIFSFDRILNINVTEDHFQIDPDFDAEEYFKDYFGVLTDDTTALERVVLRAFGREAYYLRDLPLHESQREISTTDEYMDFELRLRPTNDFRSELMGRGASIRILQPGWLADEIRKMHLQAAGIIDN